MIGTIPESEQYELVFERQDRYSIQAHIALDTLANNPNPLFRNKNGQLKIAKWSFASSESTMLFDQADYLCYALAQKHKAPHSKRSLWTSSILESHTDTIGRIMTREEIREAVMHEPCPGSNYI
jgi:hypothetical protein